MIDLRLLRDDETYRRGAVAKGATPEQINELLERESSRRQALTTVESLRAGSNAASRQIAQADPADRPARIEAAGRRKAQLGAAEAELAELDAAVAERALRIPNPAHESVPEGGEDDFRVETVVGPTGPTPAFDHGKLGELLDTNY